MLNASGESIAFANEAARRRAAGVMMLLVASVLWSVSGVAVKIVHMDAIGFAFWRSLSAGLGMLLLLPLTKGAVPAAKPMALAVCVHAAVVTLLIMAMTASTAAAGIVLQYTGPVFVALFAWWFQGRGIKRRTAVALTIAMIGVTIMLVGRDGSAGMVGPICGTISGVAFGALILVLESVNRRPDGRAVNPFLIVTLNNLGTALVILPIALAWRGIGAAPWQIGIVAATGVVQLAVPYVLFVMALRRVEPVDASLLILLEPVLNPVWVWMAVGERPDVATFFGGAAILVAMVVEATNPKHAVSVQVPHET